MKPNPASPFGYVWTNQHTKERRIKVSPQSAKRLMRARWMSVRCIWTCTHAPLFRAPCFLFFLNTLMQQASLTSTTMKTTEKASVGQLPTQEWTHISILLSYRPTIHVQWGLAQKSHPGGSINFGSQLSGLLWETSNRLFLIFIIFLSRYLHISSCSLATAKASPKAPA
jgi:hypothetical protein